MLVKMKNDEIIRILHDRFGKDADFELYFNERIYENSEEIRNKEVIISVVGCKLIIEATDC